MLKYLTKKKNIFWYRRKIRTDKEILLSLKTKDYNVAVLRHSYINCEVNYLLANGIKAMTNDEIKAIVEKYKNFMLEKPVNRFSNQRDEELSTYINGEFYGGHTKEALQIAIQKYSLIHQQNDYDLVKAVTSKILERSNIKENFETIKDEDDLYAFHYELFKAEWDLLHKAKLFQETLPSESKQALQTKQEEIKSSENSIFHKKKYRMSELLKMYLDEKSITNNWSDKNVRDIKYVLGHFISWYDDCYVEDLERTHFSNFRDEVLRKLPKAPNSKLYKDKTTKEIIHIVQKNKIPTLSLTVVNKHLTRIHQVIDWAARTDYISKNLAFGLYFKDKRITRISKTLKDTYDEQDLIQLFVKSPWFSTKLKETLRYNPERIFIPLLCLFNGGAKPTELAQLHTKDIYQYQGNIWVIEFNDEDEKTLKDVVHNSRRVPIAKKILDIGFLKYVAFQKKQKSKKLFPNIKKYQNQGTNFTNDFSVYNKKHITTDSKKTFYSMRHSVNQLLKNHKTELYIINDITGHSSGSSNMDIKHYGDEQMPEKILKNVMDVSLKFDFIDLTHIKKAINEIY